MSLLLAAAVAAAAYRPNPHHRGSLAWVRRSGRASFDAVRVLAGGFGGYTNLVAGDLDGDGIDDLVTGDGAYFFGSESGPVARGQWLTGGGGVGGAHPSATRRDARRRLRQRRQPRTGAGRPDPALRPAPRCAAVAL